MKLLFQQIYLNLIALIGLGIVALLSLTFFVQIKQLDTANLWFDHTQKTIESGNQVMYDIYLMDSNIKNFFITGNDSFYNNFNNLLKLTYHDISHLKDLTRDNKIQQDRLQILQNLFLQRVARLTAISQLRKQHNLIYSLTYIQNNLTKDNSNLLVTDQMLFTLQNIINTERQLLVERKALRYENLTSATRTSLIIIIVSIFAILISLFLLNRQLLIRFVAERELKFSKKKLEKLAYFDPLTGLPNRINFMNRVKEVIQHNKGSSCLHALLYLDLDNFKNINDNFGHEVGDNFLRLLALRIEKIKYKNKIIGHISGDEFVVLIFNIMEIQDINLVLKNIFALLHEPIVVDGKQLVCTLSVGVSIYPYDAKNEHTLFKNADIALYRAKQLGKNNYQFCNTEMLNEFEKNVMLQHDLYKAINNNEFSIVYQPKMSFESKLPSGVEALLRWERPGVGLSYPADFIAYAEKNGLIIPIGEWMLRTVCRQAKKWHEAGLKMNIAVNVSAREFIIHDFARTIKNILDEMQFDPKYLEIEITESIILENSKNNLIALSYIKKLGMQITIDDFGTGFSSLSYLNLLPIDKLKIDKSFVEKIKQSNDSENIAKAIISLAHNLGIKVIAEGVETRVQYDYLKANQCDEIQGYFYCQPLPADELIKFYQKQTERMTSW